MATVTEDYVSFEIAKLLKEKGFCQNTEHEIWYVIKQFSTGCIWNSCTYKVGDITREYNDDCCIPMPTLQMAMKWLREIHNILIQVELYSKHGDYCFEVFKNTHRMIVEKDEVYNSYEDACEEAIKYCLENLI